MVYHGYENGFRTLGRQTLLEPIEWTADGWFKGLGGDLSRPMVKPKGGRRGPMRPALSDDFTRDRFGLQWAFHDPRREDAGRETYAPEGLVLAASGASPADSSPLTCAVGDRSYEAEISLDLMGEAEAGLLLFYNHKAFVGLGFTPATIKVWQYAEEQSWARIPHAGCALRLRITNHANVVTWHYSYDEGANWKRLDTRMEVSGIHHNVFGGFLALKLAIYAAGAGQVRLRDFRYRALSQTT